MTVLKLKPKKVAYEVSCILIIIFVALFSGSMFQMVYASEFQRIECIVFMLIIFSMLLKGKNFLKVRMNPNTAFLSICVIISVLDICIWGEFNYLVLYTANFASFFICYVMSENIPYKKWINYFENLSFFLASVSLICYALSDVILSSPIGFYLTGSWEFKSIGIYNIITMIPERNCGIFWEPGMYQGFLNFSILLILLKKKNSMFDLVKIIVLAVTVLTTFSTTGYVILLMLIVFGAYRLINKITKFGANLLIIFSIILFIITSGFESFYIWSMGNLPEVITAKIVTQNASYSTRVYSVIFDVILSLKYPFGVGRAVITDYVNELINIFDVVVTARTSTFSTMFVNFGFSAGVLYILLWIRGIWLFQKKELIPTVFICLIMFILLNSEPMLFHLFFGTILFYWNQK